ncbi:MAG: hypothetical protein RML56_10715 [Burkholderiales bacterium]|nr:hypothetical protein [Burkholderiales bacterium]
MDESLPQPAAWVPVSKVPRGDGSFGLFPHFVDRAKPGVIAVTRKGRALRERGELLPRLHPGALSRLAGRARGHRLARR